MQSIGCAVMVMHTRNISLRTEHGNFHSGYLYLQHEIYNVWRIETCSGVRKSWLDGIKNLQSCIYRLASCVAVPENYLIHGRGTKIVYVVLFTAGPAYVATWVLRQLFMFVY